MPASWHRRNFAGRRLHGRRPRVAFQHASHRLCLRPRRRRGALLRRRSATGERGRGDHRPADRLHDRRSCSRHDGPAARDDGGTPGAVVDTDDHGRHRPLHPVADDWTATTGSRSSATAGPGRVRRGLPRHRAELGAVRVLRLRDAVASGTDLGRILTLRRSSAASSSTPRRATASAGSTSAFASSDALGISVGNDTTDANGFFRIPVFGEEWGIADLRTVARLRERLGRLWPEASCRPGARPAPDGPGRIGKIRLDRL